MTNLLSHFYIKLGQADAPEDFMNDLGNVEVDDNLFLPDMFVIQLRDPRFTWADSPLLAVGQEVEILSSPNTDDNPQPKRLLVGEITAHEPKFPYNSIPVLEVRGYDRAHRLHRGKKTRSFVQMTDSDIISKIAREYGMQLDVDNTTEVYEYLLQNNQTDFEFIMERARRIGFNFLVDDRSLVFKKPSSLPAVTVELEYGVTLREFHPRMSTASQFKEVVVRGWDAVNKREIIGRADGTPAGAGGGGSPLGGLGEAASGALGAASQAASGAMGGVQQAAQQAIGAAASEVGSQVQSARQTALGAVPPELRGAAEAGLEYGLAQGKALAEEYLGSEATKALSALALGNSADLAQVGMELGSKVVEKAFGEAGSLVVTQHPVHTQAEAEALAKSIFAELTAGNLQAEGKAIGNPDLGAGCKVKLNGLGNKFSGEYFVTHTRHLYDAEEGYLTEFSISGRNPNTMEDLLFGGSGSNPGMKGNGAPSGVVIGIVTNNNDPEGQGRVKVKFPWLANDQESNWARVSSPMGGASRGFFVLPEVDDEVLVMFEQGDVNIPYIVGSLWNGTDKPPISSSDAVNSEGKVVKRVWKTRTGHTITLNDSDDSPGIQIIDQTGNNRIEIDSKNNQLTISLEGDIMMKAKGKINLEAQNDLSIQAQGGLNLKANSNIEIESNASIKIKGITVDLN